MALWCSVGCVAASCIGIDCYVAVIAVVDGVAAATVVVVGCCVIGGDDVVVVVVVDRIGVDACVICVGTGVEVTSYIAIVCICYC